MSSTTTSTSTSTTTSKFQLIDSGLALIVWAIAVVGIGFGVVIAFNLGEWRPAFWVGLLFPFVLGILFYVLWWVSHPSTKKWPGFVLGVIDFIVGLGAIAWLLVVALSDGDFDWGKLWWGILTALILAVVYSAIKSYGWFSHKIRK